MSVVPLHQPDENPDKQEIARLRAALNAALVDIGNLEIDLRVLRRRCTTAENALKKKHLSANGEDASRAQEVFDYWVAHCRQGSARVVFGDRRKKAVLDRLREGHTLDDLCEAIDGAAVDAYQNEKGVRYDDLELICRDEVNVDKFIRRARAHKRRFENMSPAQVIHTLAQKAGEPIHDTVLDEFGFRCVACRAHWGDMLYRPLRVRFAGKQVQMQCRECGAGLDKIREAL